MANISSEKVNDNFTKLPAYCKMPQKPGQLPLKAIEKYFTEGFLIIDEFFEPEELEPCKQAIDKMVEELATKLYDAGKIKKKFREYGLFKRLTMMEKEFPGANILLFKSGKIPKEFCDLWSNEKLLNLMEQILGPDVAGHPVWNLRTKIPNNEATNIPWHQDSAYFSEDSYKHLIASAWIPFLDANEGNGCMQVARYGHRSGKIAKHTCCSGPTWYIMLEEEDMKESLGVDLEKDVVTTPLPYGGLLLFSNIIPHRSLPNVSGDIRWSVDLRWQSPRHPWGFYGIGEGVRMRAAEQPNMEIDWQPFLSCNRKEEWQKRHHKQQQQHQGSGRETKEKEEEDEFDTTITGPWIGRWEVVNHNRHTEAFINSQ